MGFWVEREDADSSVEHAELQEAVRKANEHVWQTAGSGRLIRVREAGAGSKPDDGFREKENEDNDEHTRSPGSRRYLQSVVDVLGVEGVVDQGCFSP